MVLLRYLFISSPVQSKTVPSVLVLTLSLLAATLGIDHVISELCCKGTILQMKWLLSNNSIINSLINNVSMLDPNRCDNEVCYKGTAVYKGFLYGYTNKISKGHGTPPIKLKNNKYTNKVKFHM